MKFAVVSLFMAFVALSVEAAPRAEAACPLARMIAAVGHGVASELASATPERPAFGVSLGAVSLVEPTANQYGVSLGGACSIEHNMILTSCGMQCVGGPACGNDPGFAFGCVVGEERHRRSAVIVARNAKKVFRTRPDANGFFYFHELPQGSYQVSVVVPELGHALIAKGEIAVNTRGLAHLDLRLPDRGPNAGVQASSGPGCGRGEGYDQRTCGSSGWLNGLPLRSRDVVRAAEDYLRP
jgi:hypothetical protein